MFLSLSLVPPCLGDCPHLALCPAGRACPNGSESVPCPPDHYSFLGQTTCQPCPEGFKSVTQYTDNSQLVLYMVHYASCTLEHCLLDHLAFRFKSYLMQVIYILRKCTVLGKLNLKFLCIAN